MTPADLALECASLRARLIAFFGASEEELKTVERYLDCLQENIAATAGDIDGLVTLVVPRGEYIPDDLLMTVIVRPGYDSHSLVMMPVEERPQ